MSTLVSNLIDRALVKIADPGGRRNLRPAMLQYFNEVQHEIATSLRPLEADYYFNLEANEGAYSYPADRVQVKKVRVTQSTAPTGLTNYYPLNEVFEDEFTSFTSLARGSGYISGYFARPEWFELLSTPPSDIIDGGLITVCRIPVWIAAETAQSVMELPDLCRVTVQHGMEILARYSGRDRAAAADDWQKWKLEMMDLESKISDPSIDRRASVRPPGTLYNRGAR